MTDEPFNKARCAIYTRKSAASPLEQEITSLHSQRAICSAYVASQKHKGWRELEKSYDDAGRTGANLNRPALQDLLTDIEEGLVDVVLVYKLDRITRTLLDFIRLIDFFDRYGVVFVSITQNFDTSDSMGRLIRNVLLTFAQFEREIASDRIRDKKMVMKQSGRWTGGDAPIGYDLKKGKLVPNEVEAEAVRCAFLTYIKEKRLSAVHKALLAGGHRRKVWRTANGERRGGTPISLTSLHHVLQNPVYIGEVTYRGERYSGLHKPILERVLWEEAQVVLAERRLFKPRLPEHLLAGLLWDAYGRRMNARQSCNGAGSHRYYDSAACAWAARRHLKVLRVAARQIEDLVRISIQHQLLEPAGLRRQLLDHGLGGPELNQLCTAGPSAAARLKGMRPRQLSGLYKQLISRIEVGFDRLHISLRAAALIAFLRWDGVGTFRMSDLELSRAKQLIGVELSVHLYRQRREGWLPVQPCLAQLAPNPSLLALLDDAREAQRLVLRHRDRSISELAWSVGKKPAHFSRLIRLNYLAPDIVTSIVDGRQPATLSRSLLVKTDLPLDWAIQRRILGYRSLYGEQERTDENRADPLTL